LFFGADPQVVAEHQAAVHAAKLAEYEALRDQVGDVMSPPQRRALEVGIAHERASVAMWQAAGRA
jgi:PadR family transcriptional regulator AphA